MRASVVSFVVAVILAPSTLGAQGQRTLEFGVTTGASHLESRASYSGEGRWENAIGIRVDARLMPTRVGVMGLSAALDRYSYAEEGLSCVRECPTFAAASGIPLPSGYFPFYQPWGVTRLTIGVTLDRPIVRSLHANIGLNAGGMSRSFEKSNLPDSLTGRSLSSTRHWVAGAEAGVTYRWRDLAVGVTGEYGRTAKAPGTANVLKEGYSRVNGRIAYAIPLGGR